MLASAPISRSANDEGLLRSIRLFNILEAASAFHATYREAIRGTEAGNHPSLVLQRAQDAFIKSCRALEVDDVDVPIRRGEYKKLVFHVHGVDTFLTCYCCNGGRLSKVPVPQGLVP